MSDPDTFLLDDDFNETERGNIWLTRGMNHVIWIHLDGTLRLEIAITPGNYPGLIVQLIDRTDAELATHILTVCAGWAIRKLNLTDPRLEGIKDEIPTVEEVNDDEPG